MSDQPVRISRRTALRSAGAAAFLGATAGSAQAQDREHAAGGSQRIGPGPAKVIFHLNGKKVELRVEPRVTLLDALRDHLGATGSKRVCDRGACGACTVWVNKKVVNACMMLAVDVHGARPRPKTSGHGVELSYVDLHPALATRYAHMRDKAGYCLVYQGNRSHIPWPPEHELRRLVEESNFTAVGKSLGVSGVAVRKRLSRQVSRARLSRRKKKSKTATETTRQELAETLSAKAGRITREAGLYEEGSQPYHVLRHTFASQSLLAGRPPAVVAAEMGISLNTVMKYYFHSIPRSELDGDRRTNSWGLTQEDLDTTRAGKLRRSG